MKKGKVRIMGILCVLILVAGGVLIYQYGGKTKPQFCSNICLLIA